MYGFSQVKNSRVIRVKNFFLKRRACYLAIAAYFQTFFITSSMLWERLLKKLRF